MSDINVIYKGSSIGTMDDTGSTTLETAGKYCEDDITIEYTKPSGGDTSVEDMILDGTISTYSNSNVTTLKKFAFAECYDLKEVNLPNVSYANQSAFRLCQTLSTIELPSCEYIGDYAFDSCYTLSTASFPAATYIGQRAFRQCSNLYSLYLLGSSMASISTNNVFTGTPMSTSTASGYGSIYVPASLISVYRADDKWSYFRSRFVSI